MKSYRVTSFIRQFIWFLLAIVGWFLTIDGIILFHGNGSLWFALLAAFGALLSAFAFKESAQP